jgi:hypothetical protein
MPLAPLFNLSWYGPQSAAMIVSDSQGTMLSQAVRTIRPALQVQGIGSTHVFRPYRGRNAAFTAQGIGLAQMRSVRNVRAGLEVAVNTLSQDDVTGAVLEAKIEGSITLKQALRILLANAAGDAVGLDSTSKLYKSVVDPAKIRLAGTVVAGVRTITTLNPD